jgi:inorganic triphosphatase YgiF
MELEQKYLVRDWGTMDEARRVLSALAQVTQSKTQEQHDCYYDTEDLGLLRRGASLRIRRKKDRYTLTIKTGGDRTEGRFCREEQEFPLNRPDPELCRAAILSAFPDLRADCSFHPTAQVDNCRTTLLLDGLVEGALDQVTYFCLPNGENTELQLELEVVADGGEELLDRLIQALRTVPGLTPMTESKYQRAMRER